MEIVDSTGRAVRLEAELFRGGEGTIHAVAGRSDVLAKLYHSRIDDLKQAKLTAMTRTAQEALLRVAAWPSATLHAGRRGRMIGFVMPRFDGRRLELHHLYTPSTRKQKFTTADWSFLMHAARNVAAAVHTVHNAGHVVGDVNQRNFIVGRDATVKVLDCDSFQIREPGRTFFCEVGMPEFTPPELQNRVLAGIERTPNHDAFGLAVLCFQLLFMGRHPFAGRFLGRGEMPIERAIAEGRFAFGRHSASRQMQPPPNIARFESLPPRLVALFEAAFTPGGSRPSPNHWVLALEAALSELRACALEPMHKYYKALPECSWCRLEDAGIYFFIGVAPARTATFDVGKLWADIIAVTGLPYEPPLRPTLQLTGASVPIALGTRRNLAIVAKVVGIVLLVLGGGVLPEWIVPFVLVIAVVIAVPLPGTAEKRRRLSRFREAERAWNAAYAQRERELSIEPLQRKRIELQRIRDLHAALDGERQRELVKMTQNARTVQLNRYLEQHLIRSHSISDIGPKRKSTLAAWGIDTAADVTMSNLVAVQGFGPTLRARLLAWRATLETRFVFDSKHAIPQQDLDALEYRWRHRRADLEQQLRAGAEEARRIQKAILQRRQTVAAELVAPAREWAQAAADLEVLNATIGGRSR